jgi:hypothetical protein
MSEPQVAYNVPAALLVRSVSNGVIIERDLGPRAVEISGMHVFTDHNAFAEYMRAWFVANHGEKPVTQLPQGRPRGFVQNGEG